MKKLLWVHNLLFDCLNAIRSNNVLGICAKKAGIKLEDCPLFTYHYMNHEICEYRRFITMHHFPPELLLRIYDNLIDPNPGTLCQKYTPVFSTHKWLLDNVLKPNKMYRKNVC